ncbi:hypothetical protein Q5752_005474 [Cryptotrichosporon argae]
MPKCTHHGCGQVFDESDNAEGSCAYHPGGPVFHEGLKSWSCCQEINRPVMEFDAFMALPTCAKGTHTAAVASKPAVAAPAPAPTATIDGVEVYGGAAEPVMSVASVTPAAPVPVSASASATATPSAPSMSASAAASPAPPVIEEDDLSVPVPSGARCRRSACGAEWEGEAVSRGQGERAMCRFHPQAAIFHEGSKGYLCCKRRVLEFDEFLKLPGCTEGTHLFVGAKRDETKVEAVDARIDHYQTPTQVIVSVFAKNADRTTSSITFTEHTVSLSLALPASRRFTRVLNLYGPIDPAASTFRILGTKVELTLAKPAAASWPLLELPKEGSELPPGYAITFGVSGRTGTVGGKEIVLAAEERAKRA